MDRTLARDALRARTLGAISTAVSAKPTSVANESTLSWLTSEMVGVCSPNGIITPWPRIEAATVTLSR